jgi:hypothetical protein
MISWKLVVNEYITHLLRRSDLESALEASKFSVAGPLHFLICDFSKFEVHVWQKFSKFKIIFGSLAKTAANPTKFDLPLQTTSQFRLAV